MKVLCRIFVRILFCSWVGPCWKLELMIFYLKKSAIVQFFKKIEIWWTRIPFLTPQKKNPLYVLKSKFSGQKMKKIA
jgi:hypothetical protein